MMTHQEAAIIFSKARDKAKGAKLENNTYLVALPNGDYAVKLHRTNVVVIHVDGTYTLTSGNWHTSTTKDRINGYSPIRIHQVKGNWFYRSQGTYRENQKYPEFQDGMKVNAQGEIINEKQ